ncbi:MAG: hypothetical protein ACRCXZ_05125, partial [Patescibacteria group bacterium]
MLRKIKITISVLVIVLVSISTIIAIGSTSIVKCYKNTNAYCVFINSTVSNYNAQRCLQDDMNRFVDLFSKATDVITIQSQAQSNQFKSDIPVNFFPARDPDNNSSWDEWLPASKSDRPPYEGILRCGWTDKMIAKREQLKTFSNVSSCFETNYINNLDSLDANKQLTNCVDSCELVETLDYELLTQANVTNGTNNTTNSAKLTEDELNKKINQFNNKFCNDLVLDDSIEIDLEASEQESDSDSKKATLKELLDEILEQLKSKPQEYFDYFISKPFDDLLNSFQNCKIDIGCYKDLGDKFITQASEIFKNFFEGIVEGIGDRFKDEIQSLFDFVAVFKSFANHFGKVFGSIANYMSLETNLITGKLPSFKFEEFKNDLFQPIKDIQQAFSQLFNPATWEAMVFSELETLNEALAKPIPQQVRYVSAKLGQLAGEGMITGLKTLATIFSGGAAASSFAMKLGQLSTTVVTKIPSLKKGADLLRIMHKKGLKLTNTISDLRLSIIKKAGENRFVAKAKDISDNLEKISTKSYEEANKAKQKIYSLAKIDKLSPTLRNKLTNTIDNKIEYGVCTIKRESNQLIGLNGSNTSIDNNKIASTNFDSSMIAVTTPTKQSDQKDPTKTKYGCVNINENKEFETQSISQCFANINIDKDSSSGYRQKFIDGYRVVDDVIRFEIEDYYENRSGK